jgi:hypothetical protein
VISECLEASRLLRERAITRDAYDALPCMRLFNGLSLQKYMDLACSFDLARILDPGLKPAAPAAQKAARKKRCRQRHAAALQSPPAPPAGRSRHALGAYAPRPCIQDAIDFAKTRPVTHIRGLGAMPLYDQMPFTGPDLERLWDPRVGLGVIGAGTQTGKGLYVGWAALNFLLRVPCVYVLMGINAMAALDGLYDKVFGGCRQAPAQLDRPTSYFAKVGLHAVDIPCDVWTDMTPSSRRNVVVESIEYGVPRVFCALANKANLDAMFRGLSDEHLARVAVIIDESHDNFDVWAPDACKKVNNPGAAASPKGKGQPATASWGATALKNWLFRERAGGVDLRVHALHLVTACSGDLANVLKWSGMPHLDKAAPPGQDPAAAAAWHSIRSPLDRLKQRGYVSLDDLKAAIPAASALRASQLKAENGYGLDRRGNYLGKSDAQFVGGVGMEDVEPDLYNYITRYADHPGASRAMLVLRTGVQTDTGVNMFRTTRAILKLWRGKVAALVSCGAGVYWLRDEGQVQEGQEGAYLEGQERFGSFLDAVDAVQADEDYRPRLLLVHANNMDGSVTLQCSARVPAGAIFCGLANDGSNINTAVNHLGRLTGYGMGLDGEPPSVFAHPDELAVARAVPEFQNVLFANAALHGEHAVGRFPAAAGGLIESGVRQGSGKSNVLGHVR